MVFKHVTNLRIPLSPIDLAFLSDLQDYRFGRPVAAEGDTAQPAHVMRENGIVGLYATRGALMSDIVMKRTGWVNPDKELGEAWRPL